MTHSPSCQSIYTYYTFACTFMQCILCTLICSNNNDCISFPLPIPSPPPPPPFSLLMIRGDRYDALRICIGQDMIQKLADLKLFMVYITHTILYYVYSQTSL